MASPSHIKNTNCCDHKNSQDGRAITYKGCSVLQAYIFNDKQSLRLEVR
jgi:hypothetical protein